jgi:UDP-2-acetamido-2,6-beta-L-arabino-hexul-4-ose reductase
MKTLLISGTNGFIGSSIIRRFGKEYTIITFRIDDDFELLSKKINSADIIIHCSAVTRSEIESDFFMINFHFSSILFEILKKLNNKIIFFFSSIHYSSESLYSVSKRYSEFLLGDSLSNSHSVFIYRLPGIFGEGAKPYKFSVVSTFAYNAIINKKSELIDPDKELRLLYINDLIDEMYNAIINSIHIVRIGYSLVVEFEYEIKIKVKELNNLMLEFASKKKHIQFNMDPEKQKFYKTFINLKNYEDV